jgi:oxygen-independent coproporphyrinogen-3 oxidase
MWGIQTSEVKEKFGEMFHTHLLENISPFVNDGFVEFSNHTFTLTATGKLVADHITSELFLV